MDIEQTKARLRDACLTPVQYRALLGVVDAVAQTHTGPAAFAVLRRTIVDAGREAGAPV